VICEGAYIHDGTETIGTRVWCSGKVGSTFATWNDSIDEALNDDWAAIMRTHYTIADATASPVLNTAVGYLNPSLVVIALGSNETSTTTANIATAMATLVGNIQNTPGGANTLPSFAFLINPTNGSKTDAYWAPIVTAMYAKAEELGCAIWDWSDLFGPYSSATGDPFGWSADNLHPSNPGHVALGDFAAREALAGVSPIAAIEGLTNSISATAPVTWDSATRTIAATASSTSASGVVQLTDSTTSTSTTTAATANAVKLSVDRYRDAQSSSSTALDVVPRAQTTGGTAGVSGTVYFSFFTPATNMTISQISYAVAGTVSVWSGASPLSRFGLYTFDGTTATLVARTSGAVGTTFNTPNTVYPRSFDTTGGYPATYDLVAGNRYAIAVIGVSSGAVGNLVSLTGTTSVLALAPRLNGTNTGQTDLPTSTSSFGAPTVLYWGRVS
jgi:hypothetical protein